MKKLIILLASTFILAACSAGITEVKTGMSTSEVEKLMGKPNMSSSSSSSSSINSDTVSATSTAEWTYNGKGKINFENDKVISVTEKK